MAARTALVVEDDPDIRELIGETLSGADFTVHTTESGEGIEQLLTQHQPDLITLDIGLPGMDGVEVCKLIRETSQAYIIMLTARTDIDDRLVGLEAGADDYLSKPFSTRELRARADALFRRSRELVGVGDGGGTGDGRTSRPDLSVGGGLVILQDRLEAKLGDKVLPLTRTEYDLLLRFVDRPGKVWARRALEEELWGSEFRGSRHLLDVHLSNLRAKLHTQDDHQWITTVRGMGFRFDPPESDGPA